LAALTVRIGGLLPGSSQQHNHHLHDSRSEPTPALINVVSNRKVLECRHRGRYVWRLINWLFLLSCLVAEAGYQQYHHGGFPMKSPTCSTLPEILISYTNCGDKARRAEIALLKSEPSVAKSERSSWSSNLFEAAQEFACSQDRLSMANS